MTSIDDIENKLEDITKKLTELHIQLRALKTTEPRTIKPHTVSAEKSPPRVRVRVTPSTGLRDSRGSEIFIGDRVTYRPSKVRDSNDRSASGYAHRASPSNKYLYIRPKLNSYRGEVYRAPGNVTLK